MIREICLEDALPVRQRTIWEDNDSDLVMLPDDHKAMHFGLFVNRELVSVVSTFETGKIVQFRKFGTLPECRRRGYGSKLLVFMIAFMEKRNISKIWCYASSDRIDFYSNFGFVLTSIKSKREGIEYVVMERRKVSMRITLAENA
ncbi:GNAT family N-acetyltransferase [Arthrospiribacter ruber]|uniref:GNAT family N-acetyltransferase n=1 Tax=Arthrospiribacter ruber TaxID=2487934 RepID=UPI001FE4F8E1|nr:GNAT family N-acetyltransferase [Arthrospiribacter ruber]